MKFSLGFKMALPPSYCTKIYGHSGLVAKYRIEVTGAPTIIDEDFTGTVAVWLTNTDMTKSYEVKCKDRIAQMVFERATTATW